MKFIKIFLGVCYMLIYLESSCQFEPLKKDILLTDAFNRDIPREKIFIHYDRPFYYADDTLWLKGYILTAKDNLAADSSKIAYIEIINSSGEVIKRVSTYCSAGIFFANIMLKEIDFKEGSYLLRAYTSYMRNYGDSLFFESGFRIVSPGSSEWSLSIHTIKLLNKRFVLNADLQPLSREPAKQQNVSVILKAKNNVIFKQKTATDGSGYISIDTVIRKESTAHTLQL